MQIYPGLRKKTPTVKWVEAGIHTVKLRVKDDDGAWSSYTIGDIIVKHKMKLEISADKTVCTHGDIIWLKANVKDLEGDPTSATVTYHTLETGIRGTMAGSNGEYGYGVKVPTEPGTYIIEVTAKVEGDEVTGAISIKVSRKQILFEDTFDEGLEKWGLFGSPRPTIRTDVGNPAPCFDNKGDANYDSGAFSKERFDYSNGLIIECDMSVKDARYNGCWVSAHFGIASKVHSSDYDGTPTAIGVFILGCGSCVLGRS